MAYSLRYYCEFDGFDGEPYRVEILEKNYNELPTELLGSGRPLIHKWANEDIFCGIKGSSIEFSYINQGNDPVYNFSGEDDKFKLIVFSGYNKLFEGFVVQDDCSEIQVDYAHEVTISATDNLGLLKEVPLNYAAIYTGEEVSLTGAVSGIQGSNIIEISGHNQSLVDVGDAIQVFITTQYLFTIISKQDFAGYSAYTISESVPYTVNGMSQTFKRIRPLNLLQKQPLVKIIASCLKATGITLNFSILSEYTPVNGVVNRCFEDACINPLMWFNGDVWENCYKVLEDVLLRFRFTLMQAKGEWYIISFDEVKSNLYKHKGYRYNTDGTYQATTEIDFGFNYGNGSDIVIGLLATLESPYKLSKENFEYKQPKELLRNADLKELGSLIREYTTGSGVDLKTIKEYVAIGWQRGWEWNSAGTALGYNTGNEIFIRIEFDYKNNEKDRYLVTKGAPGFSDNVAIMNNYIEANKDDKFALSVTYRTSNSVPGGVWAGFRNNHIFALPLVPRQRYYLLGDGSWYNNTGATEISQWTPAGDNLNNWHTFEFESREFPKDGRLYIALPELSHKENNIYHETHFKSISLKYIAQIAGQRNVNGHWHKAEKPEYLKKKNELSISIDDAPSNSIAGCLFLPTNGPVLRNRIEKWKRKLNNIEQLKLGAITTLSFMEWRKKSRLKLEGELLNIKQNGNNISPLSLINISFFSDKYFAIGSLEINYKMGRASRVVLVEICDVGVAENNTSYSFGYNYGES